MADKKTLEYQIKVLAQEAVTQLTDMSSKLKDMAQKASSASESIKKNSVTFINLESAAKQAAVSVKLFGASSSELRIMQQKLKEGAVSLVAQGFKPEQEEVKKLVEQYKSLGRQADELDAKSGDITTVFSKLKAEIGNVAAVAAAIKFDQFLVKVGDYALKSADAINTVRNNFGIMLNDMEAGSALADRINAFNVNTPFNLEELSTATQVLKTAKVSLNDMEEYLTRFGDLALGDSQKFASFTNAFAKASAKGKADMEVLNIYMERGIPILDTLAKNLGKTTAEITDMSSKGKISFHDLNEAIKTLTDEGGGYFGTMNLAADSWASTLAGAREATNSLAASLGNMLMPILKKIVNAYTDITNAINSSPLLKGLLAGAVTALAVAINMKMIVALVSHVAKIWTTYAAQMALNSALSLTNPLMLAGIAAVTAATAGFVAYAAAQQKAASESNEAALAAQKHKEALIELKSVSDDMSLREAQGVLESYTSALVPAARKELEEAKRILAETPEKLSKEIGRTVHIRGKRVSSYEVENPAFKQAEQSVSSAQSKLDELLKGLEAAQEAVSGLKKRMADFTTEWTDRLAEGSSSGIEKIRQQEAKSLRELNKQAAAAFGESYSKNEAYQKQRSALESFYSRLRIQQTEKEEDEKKKKITAALKEINAWAAKGGSSPYQRIQEQIKALSGEIAVETEKLRESAETAYGKEFEKEKGYEKALNALREYYQNKEHELRMSQIEEYNGRFKKIIDELNLKTVEAINTGDVKEAAKNGTKAAATSSLSSTEAGKIAEGYSSGGIAGATVEVIKSFVSAIVTAVSSLENGSKVLNCVTTIVKRMFDVIGPIVNELLEPIADLLESLGEALGDLFRPFAEIFNILMHINPYLILIQAALSAITWILDKIWDALLPIFNGFISIYNFLADVLNTFGLHIKHMKKLADSSGDLAAETAKQSELMKKQYERQMQTVNDLLNSQVNSIKTQYELGLMSRDEYNRKAEEYASAADDKLYELEKEMNKKLSDISENTGDIVFEVKSLGDYISDFGDWIKDGAGYVKDKVVGFFENFWSNIVDAVKNAVFGTGGKAKEAVQNAATTAKENAEGALETAKEIAEGAIDAVQGAFETVKETGKNIWNKATSWLSGRSVGTTNLPEDEVALIHKGETIVPATFAEGIRRGDLALVGGKGKSASSSGNVIQLSLTVQGSVVTENELTDIVYTGIARAIQSGSKAPLPMSA